MCPKVLPFAVLFVLAASVATKPYETKYDGIDLNEILQSDRLLNNYVKCLMSEGPCTPDGFELKKSLPDAIETECSKCSEKQRDGSEKVTHYLIDNKPDQWERLGKIYDKDGEYRRKYLEAKELEAMKSDQNNTAVTENITNEFTTE